jgi:hypothetical protein
VLPVRARSAAVTLHGVSEQIHVHRSADWFESELQPIPRAEWDAYVAAHDDLVPALEQLIRWTEHPAGAEIDLAWMDGRIVSDNVDRPTRVRLARIAASLRGVLQGDDCEVYGSDGEPLIEHDAAAVLAENDAAAHAGGEPLWDPSRPTSRGEFLRGLLRRE